ncbi:MAG: ABC transporter permease [Terriglobales bacterium]
MLLDLVCVWRFLTRERAYSAGAIAVIALAVSINAVVFAFVGPALIAPLPFARQGSALVAFSETNRFGQDPEGVAPRDYAQLESLRSIVAVGAYVNGPEVTFTVGRGASLRVPGAVVSGTFFATLGQPATLGRVLAPSDDSEGAPDAVVLSNALWRERFAANPDVLGASILLNDRRYVVIGVMPATFQFPAGAEFWLGKISDAYRAISSTEVIVPSYGVVGRMRPGATLAPVRHEIAALRPEGTSGTGNLRFRAEPMREYLYGSARLVLELAWAVALCFLAIACGSIATLAAARWNSREGEIQMRAALGGGRFALVRPALLEALILGVGGTGAGVFLALSLFDWLRAISPVRLPVGTPSVAPAYVAALMLVGILAIALPPAAGLSRRALERPRAARPDRSGVAARNVIVIAQIALAMGFAAAGIMAAGALRRVLDLPTGLTGAPGRVLVADFTAGAGAHAAVFARVLQQAKALPAVEEAAWSSQVPVRDGALILPLRHRQESGAAVMAMADCFIVSSGYPKAVGLPIIAGRGWQSPADRGVLVDQVAARTFWRLRSPLGQWISFAPPGSGPKSWRKVIGLVPSVMTGGAGGLPQVYALFDGFPVPFASRVLVVRTFRPQLVSAELRSVLRAAAAPPQRMATLADVLRARFARQRFAAATLDLVALVGLVLVAAGVYALATYNLRRREPEFAVRIALGAQPARIRALILGNAGRWAASGSALGLLLATGSLWAGSRFLGLQGGTSALAVVAVALALVNATVFFACYLPARRAGRIAPAKLLHSQ